MKFKYVKEADILLIQLSKEKPFFAEQNGDIITHYTKESKPVELEILNARKIINKMVQEIRDKNLSASA